MDFSKAASVGSARAVHPFWKLPIEHLALVRLHRWTALPKCLSSERHNQPGERGSQTSGRPFASLYSLPSTIMSCSHAKCWSSERQPVPLPKCISAPGETNHVRATGNSMRAWATGVSQACWRQRRRAIPLQGFLWTLRRWSMRFRRQLGPSNPGSQAQYFGILLGKVAIAPGFATLPGSDLLHLVHPVRTIIVSEPKFVSGSDRALVTTP